MSAKTRLRVRRQDGPDAAPRWEEFSVETAPALNVIGCLMEIQKNPVTADGAATTPVVWDCNCLEEVCGACTMVINGKARQACTALVKDLGATITLQPLSKFPIVRDLMVDRASMFANLIRVKGWIPIDGTYDLGPSPRLAERERRFGYALSRCMTCGCCMEACPQVNSRTNFIGPAAVAQALYFNISPTGRMNMDERMEAVTGEGGLAECGNAQNCVKACPKEVPLTTGIAELNRQTTFWAIKNWLGK